jgi:two-component sensor histidine kinase
MGVGETAATSLAMVIHELATNSLKYGSLSAEEGTLDVSTRSSGDELSLIWMERGGPAVSTPPEVEGFGSKLMQRSVSRQLGGSIEHDWNDEGLVVTIQLNREKLSS